MSEWSQYFRDTHRNIFNQVVANKMLIDLIILNTPQKGRILEVGCGTAQLSLLLADSGFEVTALDMDCDVLRHAKKKVCLKEIKLNFIEGNLLDLSSIFEKQHFDTVCHSGVLEHFSDNDIVKALSEQKTISKKVVFKIPNNRNKLTDKHFGDERFMSNMKWKKLIKSAGFDNIEIIGGDSIPLYFWFIPKIFFITPEPYYNGKRAHLRKKLMFWRQYCSKHTIFICE